MTENNRIQSLLKEADLYKQQGLLKEALEKYESLHKELRANDEDASSIELLSLIEGRIAETENELDEVENASDNPELSEEVQDLIGKLFSFSKNEETAAVERAVALATFGQYDKAMEEFQKLLENGILPAAVAKNMLQCHISRSAYDAAISLLEEWIEESVFDGRELARLRDFLENILSRDGIEAELPFVEYDEPRDEVDEDKDWRISEADISEVLSIKLILDDIQGNKHIVDHDVVFQLGNSITFNIDSSQADILASLEQGLSLPRVQCYSSFYYFNAKGTVSQKERIAEGPKQGDYSIVLLLENP